MTSRLGGLLCVADVISCGDGAFGWDEDADRCMPSETPCLLCLFMQGKGTGRVHSGKQFLLFNKEGAHESLARSLDAI